MLMWRKVRRGRLGQCDVSGYGDPRRGELRQYLRVKRFLNVCIRYDRGQYIDLSLPYFGILPETGRR